MRKWMACLSVAALVFGGMAIVSAETAGAKPEKGIIIGDVIEISTYAMKGHGTEDIAEASKYRAEEGFPVGILEEETGEVWIATYRSSAPASHLETANEHVMDLMGKKVAVQGLKYKAKGVSVVRMSLISEY